MGQIRTLQTDKLRAGAEQVSYKRFDSTGAYIETVDENVLFTCPTDVVPVNQDLTRQYDRPFKTVNFKTDLTNLFVTNDNAHFMYGSHRYITGSTSFAGKTGGTTLEFISDANKNVKALSGGKYFRTDIAVNSTGNLVQMLSNDREFTTVPTRTPIQVDFDYHIVTSSTEETWDIPIRAFLQETYSSGGAIDAYYDFDAEEWKTSDSNYQAAGETTTLNAWGKKSFSMKGYTPTSASVTEFHLTVSIGYPMAKGANVSNYVEFYIDNFRIQDVFDMEGAIVSRRKQFGYNGTYTAVYDNDKNVLSNEAKTLEYYLGKIEGDYKRPRDTVNKTLEQIITQEIINDNRDFMRRYEGTFIAQTEPFLSLHKKVWIDFGADVLQEPVTCYVDAMKYNVKGAEYSIRMHVPNQDDDTGSTYNVIIE
jgi:hypothetical protein